MTTHKVVAKRGERKEHLPKRGGHETDTRTLRLSLCRGLLGERFSGDRCFAEVAKADAKLLKAFQEGLLLDARFKGRTDDDCRG